MSGENYTEKISVNINTSTLSQIDLLVDNGYYSNRSDFINQALRDELHRHQNMLDRIIDGKLEKGKHNPNSWFVGICNFDQRALAEMQASGEKGSITGYGVLGIDEEIEDAALFETVERIQVRGKVICKKSVKEHYGLK